MKPLWSGAIGFGLVNIPVKLYSATQTSNLDLDMLDRHDLSNIKFKRVNEHTGKEVSWENIVKGYWINDKYVVLDDEDFEKASAEKTKTIEITDFVSEDEINSVYYEMPYYLVPDKSGVRAYALLREALLKTKKIGVAHFVLRSKEHLALLKAEDNVIVLIRIRFAEEIRDTSDLSLPAASTVKPAELKMAVTLINQLTGKFDISNYKDTYAAELMKLIKAKAKGKAFKAPPIRIVHKKSKDLMEDLKASLELKRKKAS